jgi:uncharacterized repeat protein (TIGR03803 family)
MSTRRRGFQFIVSYAVLLAVVYGFLATAPAFAAPQSHVLHRFRGNDGEFPYYGNLIFDTSGNLYGTTYYGGNFGADCGYGCGTVFKLAPGNGKWTETVLYAFQDNGQDGYFPIGDLAIDAAGNLYGTTTEGGPYSVGTVFMLAPNADGSYSETVIYSFCSVQNCLDGQWPEAGLILDATGNLYGTTSGGGDVYGGVVFKLSPGGSGAWKEKVLYSLVGSYEGGSFAGVTFDQAGNLYGTTKGGSCFTGGTVFKLSPRKQADWYYTLLYKFSQGGKDGACPSASVVLDPAGNLYSTTSSGGNYDVGVVFKLAPRPHGQWKETVLHSFNINDGAQPYAGLVRDAGNLYGTLAFGGRNGLGSVFKLTPTRHGPGPEWAIEKVLLNFDGEDGIYPFSGLTLDAAGNLYGATYYGGNLSDCDYTGCGVIFEITP